VRAALRFSPDDEDLPGELRTLIESAAESHLLLGQVAQLTDGESPYRSRGCPAQAASVAELLHALVVDLRL